MTRRQLLAALVALPASAQFTRPGEPPSRQRLLQPRVRPGEPAWPAPEAWAALSAEVHGRLVQPSALLAPCHGGAQTPACEELKQQLRNPYFLGDQPAATQVSGWLDAWDPIRTLSSIARAYW